VAALPTLCKKRHQKSPSTGKLRRKMQQRMIMRVIGCVTMKKGSSHIHFPGEGLVAVF